VEPQDLIESWYPSDPEAERLRLQRADDAFASKMRDLDEEGTLEKIYARLRERHDGVALYWRNVYARILSEQQNAHGGKS